MVVVGSVGVGSDACVTAAVGGVAPDWAALPVQYADYTLWQNELLGIVRIRTVCSRRRSSIGRGRCRVCRIGLVLPTDRPRPGGDDAYRGDYLTVEIEAGLHQRLVDVARGAGASLFIVLQAGLAALCTRLGAGEDIPWGVRSRVVRIRVWTIWSGLRQHVGVAYRYGGDPSFAELVTRVRRRRWRRTRIRMCRSSISSSI